MIPSYEVPNAKFHVDELSPLVDILSMRNLSDFTPLSKNEIINGLTAFVNTYVKWINEKRDVSRTLDEHFLKTAERHLEECYECADRLMQGVRLW